MNSKHRKIECIHWLVTKHMRDFLFTKHIKMASILFALVHKLRNSFFFFSYFFNKLLINTAFFFLSSFHSVYLSSFTGNISNGLIKRYSQKFYFTNKNSSTSETISNNVLYFVKMRRKKNCSKLFDCLSSFQRDVIKKKGIP